MSFSDVKIDGKFTSDGKRYERINETWKNRYGYVNAIGPSTYEGDTGYRHFYDDQTVQIVTK